MSNPRLVRGVVLPIALAALSTTALAAPNHPHPYFDDKGTLDWKESLDDAQREARALSKVILIEYGRKACGNCRVLVAKLLPQPQVATRFASTCVGLAAECDPPKADPRVEALFARHLPNANMLPFVALVTPDLGWITGWAGGTDVPSLCRAVCLAESWIAKCAKPAAPAAPITKAPVPPPAPPPAPLPTPAPAVAKAPTPAPAPARLPAPPPVRTGPPAVAAAPVPAPLPAPTALPPPRPVATRGATPVSKPAAPARPVQPPTASDGVAKLLAAAQAAAAAEQWGDVIRVGNEAARLPKGSDTWEIDLLVHRARTWTLETMDAAVQAAASQRYHEAGAMLDRVERVMDRLPAREDAERGREALARLAEIDRGSPDSPEASDAARKTAYAEFRGSRWAALFRAP
jgi:hypothetical protein